MRQLLKSARCLPLPRRSPNAAANVRPPFPDRHLHPDPAGRGRRLRHFPVRREGADQPGDAAGAFRSAAAPSGPDYAQPANWIARPDLPNNPSFWAPEGYAEPLQGLPTGEAAVFFIHPTTYLQRDRWNAPLLPAATAAIAHRPVRAEPGERVQPRRRQSGRRAIARRRSAPSCSTARTRRRRSTSLMPTSTRAFDQFLAEVPPAGRSSSPGTARARCTCRGCSRERGAGS